MSKLTYDFIAVGQRVWAASDKFSKNAVPVELHITDISEATGEFAKVGVVLVDPNSTYSQKLINGKLGFYFGDEGIEPFAYDERGPQIFTTKEGIQDAIKLWAGRNPNFLTSEGVEI